MKELRVQYRGRPYRVLVAFNRRAAIPLIGGNKTGKRRWCNEFVPIADRLYNEPLEMLRRDCSMAKNFRELEAKMSPGREHARVQKHRR
jgi:hypothetical protein